MQLRITTENVINTFKNKESSLEHLQTDVSKTNIKVVLRKTVIEAKQQETAESLGNERIQLLDLKIARMEKNKDELHLKFSTRSLSITYK